MRRAKPGVYDALGSEGFELCQPVDKEDYERLAAEIGGTPLKETWRPIAVRIFHEDEGKSLKKSDAPWLGCEPLFFRPSVVEALGPVLLEYGELLPLECEEGDLVVYNPTRVIDALDEDASSITRFADGRIMLIQKHVFIADRVAGIDVFTIPMERVRPTFFSHRFVDQWKASGLKGLDFRLVWSME